jgi:hypothetical protein
MLFSVPEAQWNTSMAENIYRIAGVLSADISAGRTPAIANVLTASTSAETMPQTADANIAAVSEEITPRTANANPVASSDDPFGPASRPKHAPFP